MTREIPKCISVANRIINRTNAQNDWRYELGKPMVMLSVKRIQKIMYLCQLFAFMENTESNMIPEDFVAWTNGPAIPELYDYWVVSHEGYMNPYPNTKYQLSEEEVEVNGRRDNNKTTYVNTVPIIFLRTKKTIIDCLFILY